MKIIIFILNKNLHLYNGYNEKNLFPSKKIRLNFRKKIRLKNQILYWDMQVDTQSKKIFLIY